jgi:uncharacterized protein with beta-barrel porin domain
LGGTTFGELAYTNLPSTFKSDLSYDTNNAYLNLFLEYQPTNINQFNVTEALKNYYDTNGSILLDFGGLSPDELTQVSGELATGAQQAAFDATGQFMGAVMDEVVSGLTNSIREPVSVDGSGGALASAENGSWKRWATVVSGTHETTGDTGLGSNTINRQLGAVAGGAHFRISPALTAGYALGGGGTDFSLSNSLGRGSSEFFQVGGFLSGSFNNAYITGALAYSREHITTERTITVAGTDLLRAEFNGNTTSGRIEVGYRFDMPIANMTPYLAGQYAVLRLPSFIEETVSGANTFALDYDAKNVSNSFTELGVRLDQSFPLKDGTFAFGGRAAWVHHDTVNRNALATFQTLPEATFVVNGAQEAKDLALLTASAEWRLQNGVSLAGKLEGQFADTANSCVAKIVAAYHW